MRLKFPPSTPPRIWLIGVLTLMLLVPLLLACGSGEEESDSSSSGSATDTPRATTEPTP